MGCGLQGNFAKMTGPELKARRKDLGLTMQDVADRVGLVHRQQVYEWESGKVRPGRKHLRKLAIVLQVSIADLIVTPVNGVFTNRKDQT